MKTQFFSLLNDEQDGLALEAVNRLKTSTAAHYNQAEFGCLRSRCNKLIQAFILAVKGEQEGFAEYVRNISRDRIKEGYDLSEMQYALGVLKDLVWRLGINKVADEKERLEDLYLITSIIGSAKDRLAQQYWEASQDAVAAATPIWKKMQDAEVITLRELEEGWSKGTADQVKN